MPKLPHTAAGLLTRVSRNRARCLLIVFALVTIALISITISPLRSGFADAAPRGPGDIALYEAEISRIQLGESYYSAVGTELRKFGYPTKSLFNWRTPLPVWLIANAPSSQCGRFLIAGFAALLLATGFRFAAREGTVRQTLLTTILLLGALFPCFCDDLFVMSEVWAGVFLTLSLVAYGSDKWRLGLVAALTGLFLRELVAPYCVICLLLAVTQRRWREMAWWCVGLLAYGLFYTWHITQVWNHMRPEDVAPQGWLALGGAPFLISLAQMNAFLLVSPQWLSAVYLALVILGCANCNRGNGQRFSFTCVMYLAVFAAVGQPFNQYWGAMLAPVFCFAAVRGLAAFVDLFRVARFDTAVTRPAAEFPIHGSA
jgi:hypothetical protein